MALEALFLLTAVPLALRVPEVKAVPALPRALELDYSALRVDDVAPLDASFIHDVLGIDLSSDPTGDLPGAPAPSAPGAPVALGAPGPAPPEAPGPPPTPWEHPFTNDDFSDAIPIPGMPFTAITDTARATREPNEPEDCSGVGGTVWYQLTPPKNMGVTTNTYGSDYSTALGVFTGTGLSDLRLVRCDKDARGNAQIGFPARAGTTYYFQVTGLVTGGKLNFTVDLQGKTILSSRSDAGEVGSGNSFAPSLSDNGRFVTFESAASNLVSGDTNGVDDVFVHDLLKRHTERVSVSSSGEQANGESISPSISSVGRYVAFESLASNLAAPGCCSQVYVHDRLTQRTRLVSKSSEGEPGNGSSFGPSISGDGTTVAFTSVASNLVSDDRNQCDQTSCDDVFIHDLRTGKTTRVSISSSGEEGDDRSYDPSLSSSGRYVAFTSHANNFVDMPTGIEVYIHDRKRRITELVSVARRGGAGGGYDPDVSASGRYVTFSGHLDLIADQSGASCPDNDACRQVFVRDRVAGRTRLVSISSRGGGPDHYSSEADISPNGRFVSFASAASNLVPGDTNSVDCTQQAPIFAPACREVFVRDLFRRTTVRVSISSSGREVFGTSSSPSMSWDGSSVAFWSESPELARDDTNGAWDVFVHRQGSGRSGR